MTAKSQQTNCNNPLTALVQWYASLAQKEKQYVATFCFPVLANSKHVGDSIVVGFPTLEGLEQYLQSLNSGGTVIAACGIGALAGMIDVTVATWESDQHWHTAETILRSGAQRGLSTGDPFGTLAQIQASIADLPDAKQRSQVAAKAWNALRASILAPVVLSMWSETDPLGRAAPNK